jgi:probable HAF family extracellular repeat protein
MKQFSAIAQTCAVTGFSFSALSLFAIPAQAISFTGLSFLDSSKSSVFSYVDGVSADGSVVVGRSSSANSLGEAFRWTQSNGMTGLGFLPNDSPFPENSFKSSIATELSADGSVVVGSSMPPNKNQIQAFRWTQADGMTSLLGSDDSYAVGVSANGDVVVGTRIIGNRNYAFRWTQTDGMTGLGSLDGDGYIYHDSYATGVSADGSVIVGRVQGVYDQQAFRWTQSSGMVGLDLGSGANDVSADGSIIVGEATSSNGTEAFRWTQSSGMVGLGDLVGGSFSSTANGVSADGSVVVGKGISANGTEAFRWTQSSGMANLKETLIGAGLDLSGWTLTEATDVSADGFIIVGEGTNPSGQSEAWVVDLSPEAVPEPLTILGAMTAASFGIGFKHQLAQNKSPKKGADG